MALLSTSLIPPAWIMRLIVGVGVAVDVDAAFMVDDVDSFLPVEELARFVAGVVLD